MTNMNNISSTFNNLSSFHTHSVSVEKRLKTTFSNLLIHYYSIVYQKCISIYAFKNKKLRSADTLIHLF